MSLQNFKPECYCPTYSYYFIELITSSPILLLVLPALRILDFVLWFFYGAENPFV